MISAPTVGASAEILTSVRRLVRLRAGFDVSGVRDEQLGRRIDGFLRRHEISSSDLLRRLDQDQGLLGTFVDSLTINVTSVYRNRRHWDTLATHLAALPRDLRVWSAGCSTGAEPITLAAVCHLQGKRAEILATDVDRSALERAAAPIFSTADLAEVPHPLRGRLFQQRDEQWTPRSWLSDRIETMVHDVTSSPPARRFDLIACRNVVIYFDEDTSAKVHRHLASALRPGGLLFLGNAERVLHPERIDLELLSPFVYRSTPTRDEAPR